MDAFQVISCRYSRIDFSPPNGGNTVSLNDNLQNELYKYLPLRVQDIL